VTDYIMIELYSELTVWTVCVFDRHQPAVIAGSHT